MLNSIVPIWKNWIRATHRTMEFSQPVFTGLWEYRKDNDMEDNTNLNLDTESIRARGGINSSLTDMNEIPVFTDEFEDRISMVNQEEYLSGQELQGTIFGNQIVLEEGTGILDQMFLDGTEELIIRNEQAEAGEQTYYTWAGIMLILMAAVTCVYMYGKRGTKKNDVNN